jgi:hypothetical protein
MAWGQTLSVCDYVTPQSQFASLSLGGNYHQFNDRYTDNSGNSAGGSLVLRGSLWEESAEWGYRLEGSARLRLAEMTASLDYNLDSSGQLRRYLSDDLFLFGGFNSSGLPGQSGLTVDAVTGAGWGRFRDVTPLAKALKIHTILQEQNVLTQALTDDKLRELAQTIGKQRELGLEGVMKAIEQNLGTALNVAAVLALQEVLLTTPARSCGMDFSVAMGYNVLNPKGQNSAIVTAKANYAKALDPSTEFTANVTWRAPLPLEAWTVDTSASFHRTLSATADLSAMYRYHRAKEKGETTSRATHSTDWTLRLQLEASLSVAFALQASLGTGYEEPEWNFDVSFKYDLF